jgi:predicted dinucleotide-binding enzyme
MKVGVLGSGTVGQTLAAGFLKHGHEAMIGTREPAKLADWNKANPKGRVGSGSEAAAFGEILVLAVKGGAAAKVLREAGVANLKGKTIVDACNPLTDAPPVHGVLSCTTGPNESLMEQLQKEFSEAHLVKAFNSVGAGQMVNPQYPGGVKPTMFICGDNEGAKKTVTGILDQFGWETVDMGAVEAARGIEPLAVLWCTLGFTKNEWTHAFKLLRK